MMLVECESDTGREGRTALPNSPLPIFNFDPSPQSPIKQRTTQLTPTLLTRRVGPTQSTHDSLHYCISLTHSLTHSSLTHSLTGATPLSFLSLPPPLSHSSISSPRCRLLLLEVGEGAGGGWDERPVLTLGVDDDEEDEAEVGAGFVDVVPLAVSAFLIGGGGGGAAPLAKRAATWLGLWSLS